MPKVTKLEKNYEMRQILKDKILDILKINQENRNFTLYDLDDNDDQLKRIYELEEMCEKYFAVKSWTHFRNKDKNKLSKRSYLTLIRNIFDFCEIKYYNKQTSMMINNRVIYYMKYTVL